MAGVALQVALYADDLALFAPSAAALQAQLDVVARFCEANGLSINVDKTKCMFVHCLGNLHASGAPVETVQQYKYLGVILRVGLTRLRRTQQMALDRL